MREGGYIFCSDPDGGTEEASTFTCSHCNRVVIVKPKANPDKIGGLCYACYKMVCPTCVGQGCTPFEKKLEAMEARGRMLRDMQG